MKTKWKTNKEHPLNNNNFNECDILVYSKKFNIFSELFFEIDDYSNENEIKYYARNDEGYCKIPWNDVDLWIEMSKIKEEALSDFQTYLT